MRLCFGRPSALAVFNGSLDSLAFLRFGNRGKIAFDFAHDLVQNLVLSRLGSYGHNHLKLAQYRKAVKERPERFLLTCLHAHV